MVAHLLNVKVQSNILKRWFYLFIFLCEGPPGLPHKRSPENNVQVLTSLTVVLEKTLRVNEAPRTMWEYWFRDMHTKKEKYK